MKDLPRTQSTRGAPPARLEPATLSALRQTFKGEVLEPGAPPYDEARTIWNGMIDRRPAVIARCKDAEDVVSAVTFARNHNLLLAVKGGGHNVAGNAVCDGGVMLDLSLMNAVRVDAEERTARVEGGCLLQDMDRETQAFGLATPGGIISTTGVAGLTLGGGFGWLSRKYGLSIDNLLEAEVVTADGRVLRASERENPDLFWGLRGGGGNFGVVTAFTFKLHEVGPEVYSGLIVQPFEAAKDYLRLHREVVAGAPDELTAWLVIRRAPPLPFLPEHVHGQLVVVVPFIYLGDPAEGERLIEPLRTFGTPHGEHLGMNPYTGWQSGFDALNEPGARNYWKSHYLKDLSDGAIDAILDFAGRLPSPHCEIFIPHLQGATSRVPETATAYAHRAAPFAINIHTRWYDPEDDAACIAWVRDFFERTKPFAEGVYVNFLSDEGMGRVRDAYPQETWERLVALKNRYDPGNLFRMNQNIEPTA
jgi:FAD/FMN-containing dehydrogenase